MTFDDGSLIELNPVRAGLVDDPRDYRFCSYAGAVAGGARKMRGGGWDGLFSLRNLSQAVTASG